MVKHPVILRGYHAAINDRLAKPVLVKRTDQEFIPAVLDGVRRKATPDALGKIGTDLADSNDEGLRLFQPVHRTFNLILLEAICDRPGSPRLNPRDIVSAGFVVRRYNNSTDEGWMLRNERVLGWSKPADPRLDPDPSQRKPRLNAGNPHVNGKLARVFAALEPATERVSPLFIAPPDVCTNAGRTVLYGMVPVTSAERADEAQPAEVDPNDVDEIMPGFLRTGSTDFPIPNPSSFSQIDNVFVQDLRLIQFGWRTFEEAPESKALLGVLNRIRPEFNNGPRGLGDSLEDLCAAVILRKEGAPAIQLPNQWPRPTDAQANDIRAAAQRSLEAAIRGGLPNEQRFDQANALYRVHAFMRVRSPDGCPPHLQWSPPSEPFQIVPWWESGGRGPLHTITLPDIDATTVKSIVPNVAFAVPPKLAALLKNNSLQNFLDGNVDNSNGSIRWICSFSIPIITICAFIVLNIFLTLLHIVFQWLFYIKICLPYPSKR